MSIKLTKQELEGILDDVNKELAQVTGNSDKLSKAVGPMEDDATTEGPPPEDAGLEGSPEGDPAAGPPADAPPPGPEGEGGPGQISPQDIEALAMEYAQLPPEELEAHAIAIDAAIQMVVGEAPGGAGGPPPGGAGGPPPGGPGGAPPPPGGAPMAMSEGDIQSKIADTLKKHLDESGTASQEKIEALQGQVDTLAKALNLALGVGQPIRKAATTVAHLDKPGATSDATDAAKDLSKAEVTARLAEKTRDPSMKKTDRDLINKYYEGTVGVEGIAHLLVTE